MKRSRTRYTAILAGLLATATLVTACDNATPPPAPTTTDASVTSDTPTTDAPVVTDAPTVTDVPTVTDAPITTDAPVTPVTPPAPAETLAVKVAEGYTMRSVALSGNPNWASAEWFALDENYALIRTTEFRLGGDRVYELHLLELSTGKVVDHYAMPIDAPLHRLTQVQPGELRLYATESEGDITVVTRAASLTWDGGKLTVTAHDVQGYIPSPIDEYYLYDPVRDYTAVGGSNIIHYTENGIVEDGRVLRQPHKHDITIQTTYPVNCFPLAFLDDGILLFEVAPADAYRYATVDVRTGTVLPQPSLNGMTYAATDDGVAYFTNETTLYALDASGVCAPILRIDGKTQDLRHLGDACYVRTSADGGQGYTYTYTVYTPDGSAVRAEFAATGDAIGLGEAFVTEDNLFADGDCLYLIQHNPPVIEASVTAFAAVETGISPIPVRVNRESSFALRTLSIPGDWEAMVTHPLDDGHTLINAYYRTAPGKFATSLYLLDNATGRITASTAFAHVDELPYLAQIGGKLYLYQLRNVLGGTAQVENAVALTYTPTAIAVTPVDAAAIPAIFSTIAAPNGAYTVGLTVDYGIVRFDAAGQMTALCTPDDEISYYEPIGFLDATRLLYLYRIRESNQSSHYATVDVVTGETVTLPRLDSMTVTEAAAGMIYAEVERMDEGDFAYWAISDAGDRTLLYTVPVDEKFTRSVWTEGRFRIESEHDPKATSRTYTVYNREFTRVEAEYDLPTNIAATRLAMLTSHCIYLIGRDLPPVKVEQATYAPMVWPTQPVTAPTEPVTPPTLTVEAATGFDLRTVNLPEAKPTDAMQVFPLDERFTLFHTYDPAQTGELIAQAVHLFDRETGRIVASRAFNASRVLDRIQMQDGRAILYASLIGSAPLANPYVARQIEYGPGTLNVLPHSVFLVEDHYLSLTSPDGRYTVCSTYSYALTVSTNGGPARTLLSCPLYTDWNTAYYIPVAFVDSTRLLYTTLEGTIAMIDVADGTVLPFADLAGCTLAGYHDGVIYATEQGDGETILWAKTPAGQRREIGRTTATVRFVDGYWIEGKAGEYQIRSIDFASGVRSSITLGGISEDRYTVIGGENLLYLVGIALPETPDPPMMVAHSHSASGALRDGIVYNDRGYALAWSMPYGWRWLAKGETAELAPTDCYLTEGALHLDMTVDAWSAAGYPVDAALAGRTAAGIPYRVSRRDGAGSVYFDLGDGYAYTLRYANLTDTAALTGVLATFTFDLAPVPTPTWKTLFPDETGVLRFTYFDDLNNRNVYAFVRSDTDFAIRYHDLDDGAAGEYTVNFGRYAPERVIPIGLYARTDLNRLELYLELHQEGLVLPVAAVATDTTFGGVGVMHPDYTDLMLAYGARFYPTEGGIPTAPGPEARLHYTHEGHGSSLDWIEYDDRSYTVTLTAGIRWGGVYGARYAADAEWGPRGTIGKLYHGFSLDTLPTTPKPELGGVTASGIPYTVYDNLGQGSYEVYFTLPEGYTLAMTLNHHLYWGGKGDYETYTRPILDSVDITLGEPTFPYHAASFPEDAPYYRFAMRTHPRYAIGPTRTYYFFDGYDDPRKVKIGYLDEGVAHELKLRIPETYRYDEARFLYANNEPAYPERGTVILALRDGETWRILRFSDDPLNRNSTGEGDYAFAYEENDLYLWNTLRLIRANGIAVADFPWMGELDVTLPADTSPAAYDAAKIARMLDDQLRYGEVPLYTRVFASDTYLYFVTIPDEPEVVLLYAHTPGARSMTRIPLDLPEGYDSIRPIYVGSGGGSGECRILLAAVRDGVTTVLQYDNFAFTIGANWLDFACRGKVSDAKLFDMLLHEPDAFVGFTVSDLALAEDGMMPPFALDDRYLLYAEEWPSASTAGTRPSQRFYLVESATGRIAAIAEIATDRALDRVTQVDGQTYLWTVDPTGADPQGAYAVYRVTWGEDMLALERADGVALSVDIDTPAGVAVAAGYRMRGTHTTLWLCRANTGVHLFAETDGKVTPLTLALPADVSYNESRFHLLCDDAKPGEVTLLLTLRDGEFEGYTYRFFVYTNAANPGSTAFDAPREINMDERNQLLEHSLGVITG